MGLGPLQVLFFCSFSSSLSTPPACHEPTNMPHTHQIMTTPPPHGPNADVEDTEKCFHVPATPSEVLSASNDIAGTWARIVVPRGNFWNPRPMLLFPTPGHCSPWRVFVPHLVFGFPVQAVSPSNLNQIR